MSDTIKTQMVLDKVQLFLAEWLDGHLKHIFPANVWQNAVLNVLTPDQCSSIEEDGAQSLAELDFATLISIFVGNFRTLRREAHIDSELFDMAKHVKKIRNLCAHKNSKAIANPDREKEKYHFETLRRFVVGLGANAALLQAVDELSGSSDWSVDKMKKQNATTSKDRLSFSDSPDFGKKSTGGTKAMADKKSEEGVRATKTWSKDHAEYCLGNVNHARSMYSEIFPDDAMIIEECSKEASTIKGRGEWDNLVVLPFVGSEDKALCVVSDMWRCPDAEPYVQEGHIVWEFPPCKEASIEGDERVAAIYPAGYLPKWFDAFISDRPGTAYRPDFARVSNNLNSNTHDVYWYLGNYFPRSFVESFCLYDYIFAFGLDVVRGGKSELTICDVGVGTGGAAYGLIWALRKYLYGDKSFKKIRVIGLDGNEDALKVFREVKPVVERAWPIEFEFVVVKMLFSAREISLREAISCKADFIIASKCLQEIKQPRGAIRTLYECYFDEAQRIASVSGLISVLEIDDKSRRLALEEALCKLDSRYAVVAPWQSMEGPVAFERIDLYSSRIKSVVEENVLFAVVGPQALGEKFPRWAKAERPMRSLDVEGL